jgi:hypothetical protein
MLQRSSAYDRDCFEAVAADDLSHFEPCGCGSAQPGDDAVEVEDEQLGYRSHRRPGRVAPFSTAANIRARRDEYPGA